MFIYASLTRVLSNSVGKIFLISADRLIARGVRLFHQYAAVSRVRGPVFSLGMMAAGVGVSSEYRYCQQEQMFSRSLKLMSNGLLKCEPQASRIGSSSPRTGCAFASTKTDVLEDPKGTATFDFSKFKLHRLEEGPATTGKLSRTEALRIYKQMVTVRRMETASANLYKEKAVRGFCHLCSGQEAVYVGMSSAFRDQDSCITSYRAHGFTHCMGVDVLGVLAELTGKKTGVVRGKGGSMHMYAKNFYGGNGIVGAQVPLGTGVAFAHKYKGDGGVCFSLYGDGAANQGQVAEAFNLAMLWNLPVVFVCENNHYAMGTPTERHAASTELYKRGDYIPGIQIDGMDVMAVREATKFAINYCGEGNGPLVFEITTYRYHGHSMSDPGTSYRTKEEVQEVRQNRDPITGFRDRLVGSGLVEAAECKKIEKEIKKQVDLDTQKARIGEEIGVEELYYDIYENNLEGEIRGITPWNRHTHDKMGKAINL